MRGDFNDAVDFRCVGAAAPDGAIVAGFIDQHGERFADLAF